MNEFSLTAFNIDGWHVTPDQGVMCRDGQIVHLEPRVMDVLVYLVLRQGEVVSRDELEREVWRGALVGYDAVTKTVIKLRKALDDDARHPRCIATIPKKGYQLIAPVADSTEETGISPVLSGKPQPGGSRYYSRILWSAVLLVSFLVIVGLYGLNTKENLPGEEKIPVLLVLPFTNLDDDPRYDAFADGITEDVITDLSRLSQLFVYASNTSFRFRGVQPEAESISGEINTDYILKGSVRRLGDSLRINIQLIDARTELNVWAERYDRNVQEIFTLQTEMVRNVISRLIPKITEQQQLRLVRQTSTANLEAYDLFLAGQKAQKQRTRETHQQAKELFRSAIRLDPSYGRAYGSLAVVMALEYRRGWTDTPLETLDRALALAEQAVLLDKNIPQTHWALGFVHLMRKEYSKAEQAAAHAVEISPNYADGYGLQAFINNHLGKAELALQQITRGMKLNPFYSWDYPMNYGWANYTLGNYQQAIVSLEQAAARNENVIHIKLLLAASYIQAGRQDDAEWLIEAIRVLNPNISLEHTNNTLGIADAKLKERLLNDLHKAGME